MCKTPCFHSGCRFHSYQHDSGDNYCTSQFSCTMELLEGTTVIGGRYVHPNRAEAERQRIVAEKYTAPRLSDETQRLIRDAIHKRHYGDSLTDEELDALVAALEVTYNHTILFGPQFKLYADWLQVERDRLRSWKIAREL